MRIKAEDIVARLEQLYALGEQPDGTHTRLAFSPEDAKARQTFSSYFAALGIPVRTDAAGNLIARMEGEDPSLPAILLGSHLDTVPDGGKYDGVLGCVGGWAVCDALKRAGRTLRHPLEVVVFADEEGARFGNGMFGSNTFCGKPEELKAEDLDILGMKRGMVLGEFGLSLEVAAQARREKDTVCCCVELHVEQGASLHRQGIPVGVVSAIAGVRRFELTVSGEANHSGSTCMADRKDALVAAARFIGAVPEKVKKLGGAYTVATVGTIRVAPGAVNVIPGQCVFSLEIRDQSDTVLEVLEDELRKALAKHCQECGCEHTVVKTSMHPPAPMAAFVQDAIDASAKELGVACVSVPSGAFHDSMMLSAAFPTGMIFIPSVGGISHSPQEYSLPEDMEAGCNVLLQTVLRLDIQQ